MDTTNGRPTIRSFAPGDLTAVLDITARGWKGVSMYEMLQERHGKLGPQQWWERKRDAIRSICEENPEGVIVAELGDRVVGYAGYVVDEVCGVGTVCDNAVDPEYRGRGIGSAMHEWVLAHFRSLGLRVAFVSTLEQDEPAQRMYERHGFREIARSIHYSQELTP